MLIDFFISISSFFLVFLSASLRYYYIALISLMKKSNNLLRLWMNGIDEWRYLWRRRMNDYSKKYISDFYEWNILDTSVSVLRNNNNEEISNNAVVDVGTLRDLLAWACGWCRFLMEWIMKQIHNSQYCLLFMLRSFLWMKKKT